MKLGSALVAQGIVVQRHVWNGFAQAIHKWLEN